MGLRRNFKGFILFLVICEICVLSNAFTIVRKSEPTSSQDKFHEKDSKNNGGLLRKKCDPCPKDIKCVPQIQCPAHVRMQKHEKPQICDLPSGKFGYCCVTGQNHTIKNTKGRFFGLHTLKDSVINAGRQKFSHLLQHAPGLHVVQGHPDFFHNIVFQASPEENLENFHVSNSAVEQIITSQILQEQEHIPIEDFELNNIDVPFQSSPLSHHCTVQPQCPNLHSRYRTFDGTCNNPLESRSAWGATGQPTERVLPPAYEDGIWLPRFHGVDGIPLTGAREISRILIADVNRPHSRYNLLTMQFGQFIAHDIIQTAAMTFESGEPIECCSPDGFSVLPPEESHYACLPIHIEPHDEFYSTYSQRCINFVRLSLAPNLECKVGYGKQRSKVTHFLDASAVYGSSVEAANRLRTFRGGKLRMYNDFGRDLLPFARAGEGCGENSVGKTCFESGDGRTNQFISLVLVHILFAREHNRIADILFELNPHWSDEIIFQEARRIVTAEFQHIVYNEWLPLIVGPSQVKRFGIEARHHGYATEYDSDVNPAITSEFAAAAFRFGHSTVDGKLHVHREDFFDEIIDIPEVMFNPTRLRKRNFLDDLTRTLVSQPMQRADSAVTHGLTRFLFRGANPFGIDLAAINIHRGRDVGLRSYNDYLEVIGHPRIKDFSQFHPEVAKKLSQVYRHPDDIDLWIGGLLENSLDDAVVGTTFSEIIADQFTRLRRGDRYFYDNDKSVNPGSFTANQLDEVRKASMARIICDNVDHFTTNHVPPFAFIRADFPGNEPVPCNSLEIPIVNLEAWREPNH